LQQTLATSGNGVRVQLVMAGGYDSRVAENLEHYDELVTLSDDLELRNRFNLSQFQPKSYWTNFILKFLDNFFPKVFG
jgi:hypothetical protein